MVMLTELELSVADVSKLVNRENFASVQIFTVYSSSLMLFMKNSFTCQP